MVCLFSAGYIIFSYASPAFKRRRSRRDYDIIAGGGGAAAAGAGAHGGGAGRAAAPNATAVSGTRDPVPPGSQGGSEGAGGVLGGGWRAYGSTDEAPAGAGCLPPSASR